MDFIQSANKSTEIQKYGNISQMSLIISQLEQSLTTRFLLFMEVFHQLSIILAILMKFIEYKKFRTKDLLLIWCGVILKPTSPDLRFLQEVPDIFSARTFARNSLMKTEWMLCTELINFVKMAIKSYLVENLPRFGVLQITAIDMKT